MEFLSLDTISLFGLDAIPIIRWSSSTDEKKAEKIGDAPQCDSYQQGDSSPMVPGSRSCIKNAPVKEHDAQFYQG